jgi:hypothetical protein
MMAQQLEKLFEEAAAQPDTRLKVLKELLQGEEQRQLAMENVEFKKASLERLKYLKRRVRSLAS